MNFAGGGHQVELDPSKFSIDKSNGHITVRKDIDGIVTITTCTNTEAISNNGQCESPIYNDCNECLYGDGDGDGNTYACWCNEPNNIYGSGGCTTDTNCMWTLVSDIWNGISGDAGYTGCMTAIPEIGLEAMQPYMNSTCATSVENIVVKGSGPNNSLQWGDGSPDYCNALTTNVNMVN